MLPPNWALSGAQRLSPEEFLAEFRAAFLQLEARWLKLECWQEYQEPETKSLHAYLSGEADRVMEFIEHEAEFDREFYGHVSARGIAATRIRVVRRPLTPYLRWEMINYQVRAKLGEHIVIVDDSGGVDDLPNSQAFDFLLFDRRTALVHDYGDDGLQRGGWLVTAHEAVTRLERTAVALRQRAAPLAEFATSR